MAKKCYVGDGSSWKEVVPSAGDGTNWRTAINMWVGDGSVWRKVYSTTHGAITSLVVAPSSASLATFGTEQFTATAFDSDSVSWDVTALTTWSVYGGQESDPYIDSIDANGFFTAGGAASTPTVQGDYSGYSDTSPVTVT